MNNGVLCSYSRKQLIEAGDLVEINGEARSMGISMPIAVRREVWMEFVESTDQRIQILPSLRPTAIVIALRKALESGWHHGELFFGFGFRCDDEVLPPTTLKAVLGRGDDGEPVITVMFPDEM